MAVITIYELWDMLDTGVGNLTIKAVDLDNVEQILILSDDTKDYIRRRYGTRRYKVLKGATVTPIEACTDFTEAFLLWIKNRQHNINKQYQALYDYDYSPIENVDRYETEQIKTNDNTRYGKTTTHSGTDTVTTGGKDIKTYGSEDVLNKTGEDTLTQTGDIKNVSSKAGFNAPNSFTPDSQNIESYEGKKDVTAYGSNDSRKTDGEETLETDSKVETSHGLTMSNSGTDSNSGDSDRTLRVHGNIGVTTNTQLIDADIELRKIALVEMLIDNFINDFTFYS